MNDERHFRSLEAMYLAAPINSIFEPRVHVAHESAEIEIDVRQELFHPLGAVHGSVYFKMLDDAAFFAANSIEPKMFLLTTSFTTYLTRPVSTGKMRSVGKVVNRNRSQIIAEAVVYNSDHKEIGRGTGLFVRSKTPLTDAPGYGAP